RVALSAGGRGPSSAPFAPARRPGTHRHFAPEGASVLLVDAETGAAVDPATGRPINTPDYALIAGPAAGERTRRRYAAPKPLADERKLTPSTRKRRARARTAI